MSVANIKLLNRLAAFDASQGSTLCCKKCKSPLWNIQVAEKYGSRWAAQKTSYPGVPPYEEYWAKDQKTALRRDCPFCGDDYFAVVPVEDPDGGQPHLVPSFYIKEMEGL